jgi:hypothetical protein
MAIDNKTDLIKEIEAFSKALYDFQGLENELISQNKFKPYYSEHGILKRVDYSGDILDEEAFLIFYGLFFDMIELNPNAEELTDSQYFNTLYQIYRDKNKKELEELDLFMRVIQNSRAKEAASQNTTDNKGYNDVEEFLNNVLTNKIRKQIKSKSDSEKFLFTLMGKIKNNQEDRQITIVISSLLLLFAGAITIIFGFNILVGADLGIASLFLIVYSFLYLFIYRISKQEKEELNQLPENFKKYLLGNRVTFNEEFFNSKTTSYLDPFLKDSTIYPYIKAKYTKTESENGIINE